MCFIFLSKILIVKLQKQKLYTMGRSKKRLQMLHERRRKHEQRRREQLQKEQSRRGVNALEVLEATPKKPWFRFKLDEHPKLREYYHNFLLSLLGLLFIVLLYLLILLVCKIIEFVGYFLQDLGVLS